MSTVNRSNCPMRKWTIRFLQWLDQFENVLFGSIVCLRVQSDGVRPIVMVSYAPLLMRSRWRASPVTVSSRSPFRPTNPLAWTPTSTLTGAPPAALPTDSTPICRSSSWLIQLPHCHRHCSDAFAKHRWPDNTRMCTPAQYPALDFFQAIQAHPQT